MEDQLIKAELGLDKKKKHKKNNTCGVNHLTIGIVTGFRGGAAITALSKGTGH